MNNLSDIKNLVSGSDIRGITIGDNINLTNDIVKDISVAFSYFIENKKDIKINNQIIAVGCDSRLSSNNLKDIFINALSSIGVHVYDCGLCSTPAMSMAPKILSCCASVEITASHHPKEYNGFKFFLSDGGLEHLDIINILLITQKLYFPKSNLVGTVRNINLMEKYCDVLSSMITKELGNNAPLSGTKIVVDASNGAGGFFVDKVLKKLGADTTGSALLNPDGNFPVHPPNPEKKESISFIKKLTLENKADIGIIFDADVDRCFFIDNSGVPIVKNRFIALVSKMVLKTHPKSTIVTDSVTSDHLKKFIEKNGGLQFREKRGYQNVIRSAKDLNLDSKECFLAIETSGHAAFEENEFKDDGAYLAVKIITEMVKLKREGKSLFDEISDFEDSLESKEVRFNAKTEEEINCKLNNLKKNFKNISGCSIDNNTPEGVRLNFSNKKHKGWSLMRRSAHDLSVVLNIESDIEGGTEEILRDILDNCIDK